MSVPLPLRPGFWLCVLALSLPLGEVQRLGPVLGLLKGVVGVAALCALAWLGVAGGHFRRSPLDLPLLLFLGAMLPSLAWSTEGTDLRGALLSVIGYLILIVVVTTFVRTGSSLRAIVISLMVGAMVAAILGILQFSTGMTFFESATGRTELYMWDIDPSADPADPGVRYQRVLGTMRNPSAFASYFVAATPIALALYLSVRSRLARAVLFTTMVFFGLTLVLTFSRGGLVAGAAAMALVIVLGGLQRRHRWRTGFLIGTVVLATVIFWPSEINYYVLGFLQLSEDVSAHERLAGIWPAFQIFLDHPLFGAGFLESTRLLPRYRDTLLEGMNIHNNFLAVAAELGLVGLIPFVAILAIVVHNALRTIRSEIDPALRSLVVGLLGAFIGLHVLGLSHMNYINVQIWFLASLIIAGCRIARDAGCSAGADRLASDERGLAPKGRG